MAASKRIALVHLFSNGDCLYATTVARQIKQDFPDTELTWIISAACAPMLLHNPYVDVIEALSNVSKSDTPAFRQLERKLRAEERSGKWHRVFITHNSLGTNQAYYDGCTRSNVLQAYPNPITVPIQPVLELSAEEHAVAERFAADHSLRQYKYVILFEFAPLSGQSLITRDMAIEIAEQLVAFGDTAVILSSANRVDHPHPAVIDGSVLNLRETAALTHQVNFLLGTSSGITWMSTTSGSKALPMVQLYQPGARFENPVSRDFARFGLALHQLIEITELDVAKAVAVVRAALTDFPTAKQRYHQRIPLHFRTTRSIVYNMLVYGEFKAIWRHIRVNTQRYGAHPDFWANVVLGVLEAPFKFIKNRINKR